ncbi:MAG: 50S ribosomal protein L44e [Candidatus Methanolliviera hydrocarbonicum]|mgnify:CR=1 FL=1|uniref:Large ribosomal subunit protein eL42 n=1 Tax=Candidatus Methanolliviera hydrocarbonicum TaxID=2491085 RepID=A0A520KWL3_9EURY|nr:MAG: 50S ribosomal protein L44e [Candidatus Methanolliviera hydrocarbonicum]
MKMPKKIKTYCPYCKKSTEHSIEKVKKGRQSGLKWINRQKSRRQGIGNLGKFSKVPGGDKPTKKVNIRYRCNECKKAHTRKGFRVSKFELVG